jgi:hypothetical protein
MKRGFDENLVYWILGIVFVVVILFDVFSGNVMLSPDEYYDYYGEEYYDDMYGEYYMDSSDYADIYESEYEEDYSGKSDSVMSYRDSNLFLQSGESDDDDSVDLECEGVENCISEGGSCGGDLEGVCGNGLYCECDIDDDCEEGDDTGICECCECGKECTYTPSNNLDSCTWPDGTTCNYVDDSNNRVAECTFPGPTTCNYFNNDDGRISVCDYDDGTSCTFRDDDDNTISSCTLNPSGSCNYDLSGNLQNCVLDDGTSCVSTGPDSMSCTQSNGNTYTWIDNGDGTFTNEVDGMSCTYDSDNNLVSGDVGCGTLTGGDDGGSSEDTLEDIQVGLEGLGCLDRGTGVDVYAPASSPTMIGD